MKIARWGLMLVGLALIGVGIWRDELTTTMMNAVMICLSCMGVG